MISLETKHAMVFISRTHIVWADNRQAYK